MPYFCVYFCSVQVYTFLEDSDIVLKGLKSFETKPVKYALTCELCTFYKI